MTLEKLQLIATARVSPTFKGRLCRWWNLSKGSRQEYNFPASLASDLVLRSWIDKAVFFAGVFSLSKFELIVFLIPCAVMFY